MTTTIGRLLAMSMGLRTVQTSLRTLGFRRTMRGIQWLLDRSRADPFDGTPRWVAEIDRIARPPKPPSCLDRSVFLWYLMRLNRLDPRLRVGITASDGPLEGHAWVELEGAVVNDVADVADRFAVFDGDPVGLAFL
jgi:Transglutaminase-like superfamily